MTTAIEYALMAGASYISTRADINQFPVPDGWAERIDKRQELPSGFEATYFTKGTDIVISYAGTDESSLGDIAADGDRSWLIAITASRQILFASQGRQPHRQHHFHRPFPGGWVGGLDGGVFQRGCIHIRSGALSELG